MSLVNVTGVDDTMGGASSADVVNIVVRLLETLFCATVLFVQ